MSNDDSEVTVSTAYCSIRLELWKRWLSSSSDELMEPRRCRGGGASPKDPSSSSDELTDSSSEELNEPRRANGGIPKRESLESKELKVFVLDTETASWSGYEVVPVITDCSVVSEGGGSAGGRRDNDNLGDTELMLSATVCVRREASRRCTCCSHLVAFLLSLLCCAKPLLIFNVGASDGAIEAGAAVWDTAGGVGGLKDPSGVELFPWVGASQLDSSSPSAAVSNPSSSSARSAPMYPFQS